MATNSKSKSSPAKAKSTPPSPKPENTVQVAQNAGSVAPPPDAETIRATYEEQLAAMRKQMEELKEQVQQARQPQIVQVAQNTEKVHFLWQAEVADDNVALFGDGGMYGRIVGKSGSFYVPKTDISRVLDSINRLFLARRWLIIVSGLTDEEREALGVDYKEGEILDRRAFAKLVDMGDEILDIYPALCPGHKEMVAKRYQEAFEKGNPNVTRERVVALNKLSKAAGSEKGDFVNIIEALNLKDAE